MNNLPPTKSDPHGCGCGLIIVLVAGLVMFVNVCLVLKGLFN